MSAFQSPEGDSLFFYTEGNDGRRGVITEFQSPEGDSLFFYLLGSLLGHPLPHVSVPRRGFVVFLLTFYANDLDQAIIRFSPPKGIRCFSTGE